VKFQEEEITLEFENFKVTHLP